MTTITNAEQFEDVCTNLLERIEFIKSQGWTGKDAAALHKEFIALEKAAYAFIDTQTDEKHLKLLPAVSNSLNKIRDCIVTADTTLVKQSSDQINQNTAAMERRGGCGPGVGRKADATGPQKMVSVSISPEAAEALENLEVILRAKNQSQVVNFLLMEAWEKYEQMYPAQRPKIG